VVTSAVALGGAIGPVVGGFAASAIGLRWVFLGGGFLLLISLIPVVMIVRESPRQPRTGPRLSTLAVIDQRPGLRQSLAVLIGAQGLINAVNAATQQLLVLRLLEMLSSGVSAVTGVASSGAAVLYTRVTKRLGYVKTAVGASVMVGLAVALIGLSPWVAVVILAVGLNGLFSGVVIPATASMIGLETPPEAQSTAFGLNASSVAFGFFLGPLIGGTVAATANVTVSLLVIAVLAFGLAVLLAFGAREPVR
jgi:DHA1 family multidrug resistance protein-like MFS transporter